MNPQIARRTRIYHHQPLTGKGELRLEPATAHHLLKVLRLRPGDSFLLFDGGGHDHPGEILRIQGDTVIARIGAASAPEPPAPLAIHLGLGVSKGERMDFAIQKAVELGVAEITPLWSERSVVKLQDQRLERRIAHWRGVLISACEQCGRRRLPLLHPPAPLTHWLAQPKPGGILLHAGATQGFASLPPPEAGAITLLIGPEGGLAAAEREQALQHGFQGARLGPRILRAETAPLAAIAVAQMLWGDFRGDFCDTGRLA